MMNNDLDLAESVLPYEVRHSVWDPKPVEDQLEDRGLYEPDAIYLFSVPDNEQERHVNQIEQLADDIAVPDTVYFNEDSREEFSNLLNRFSSAEHVAISYPENGSRKADFQALNEYLDSDQSFLGIAQDYSIPRNHREAARHVDEWNGPENGFAFDVEGEFERGSSFVNYLIDRLNTHDLRRRPEKFGEDLNLKEGDHFIVGTTYNLDFENYRSKFGIGKESEIVRTYMPQAAKDWLKDTPAVDDEEI